MKYEKVYGEIIKAYVDKEIKIKNKFARIILGTADPLSGTIGITTNGYNAYFVDARIFPFDVEKVFHDNQTDVFRNLYKIGDSDEVTLVYMTGDMKVDKGRTLVKIGTKWVDKKYLANFENPTFKTNDSISTPVYVYEDGILVGLVMPVKLKEEQNNEQR